jgi:hypothetical protein
MKDMKIHAFPAKWSSFMVDFGFPKLWNWMVICMEE